MNEQSHLRLVKVSYKIFPKGSSFLFLSQSLTEFFRFSSVEQAILKMTKGEHAQLKLKSKATKGVDKFNIPVNTPVQYEVTLNNFEKVQHLHRTKPMSFHWIF